MSGSKDDPELGLLDDDETENNEDARVFPPQRYFPPEKSPKNETLIFPSHLCRTSR
jgi:hypothetical protein